MNHARINRAADIQDYAKVVDMKVLLAHRQAERLFMRDMKDYRAQQPLHLVLPMSELWLFCIAMVAIGVVIGLFAAPWIAS